MSRYKLTIEVDDLADLTRVAQSLEATLGADPGGALGQVATAPPAAAPAKGKNAVKKTPGKKRGKKAAAKPATSAIDDLLGASDDTEAEARTQEDVMGMFERVAETHGETIAPAILAILQQHDCQKLSDLDEEHYGSVYDQLDAMLTATD